MKKPTDLEPAALLEIVERVVQAIYPKSDPDKEWDVDMLDTIDTALSDHGLTPDKYARPR